jgi:hypothetical protein
MHSPADQSMRKLVFGLVIATSVFCPTYASAWHQHGHMAVARIAWKELDDKQQLIYSKILQGHPHFDLFLKDERPNGMKEAEWVFVRAATWPDWIREPRAPGLNQDDKYAIQRKYDKPAWHFVNLPYIHPLDAGKFDEAAIRKSVLTPELDAKNEPRHALAALKAALSRLQDSSADPEDRAVALCWVLHLVGDLHQPLHASALIATEQSFGKFEPPHGDEGGNLIAIKLTQDDKAATKLHGYWDALLFQDEPQFNRIDDVVAQLMQKMPAKDLQKEINEQDYLAWAEESLQLAKTVAYTADGQQGFLKGTPLPANKRVDLRGFDAPILPASYQRKAEEVAGRRMILAGYRLAKQLSKNP